MKHFKAIAAMSENRVIGSGNKIPWHLPEDFKWFKRMTTGNVIVMGRKTFESIGKPLPNRETIVLTRSGFSYPGVSRTGILPVPSADRLEACPTLLRCIRDLSELDLAHETRDVFICGGAEIYAQALPLCSDLYLTLVKRIVDGDAFFPPFEHLFAPVEVIVETPEFRITHYRNARPKRPEDLKVAG